MSDFFNVLHYKMLLTFREFDGKYKNYLPFLNFKLYCFFVLIRIILMFVMLEISSLFFEYDLFEIEVAYIVVLCFFIFTVSVLSASLKMQDEKYRIFTYFLGGLFNWNEKIKNEKALIYFTWLFHFSVFILFFIFILKTTYFMGEMNTIGNLLFHFNLLLIMGLIILYQCMSYFKKFNYGLNRKKSNDKSKIPFVFIGGTVLVVICKIYDENFNDDIKKIYTFFYNVLSEMIQKNHSIVLNVVIMIIIIFCYKILISERYTFRVKLNNKVVFFNNHNFLKRMSLNPLVKDFINGEVLSKLSIVPFMILILFFVPISSIKQNLILTVAIGFLFTQYNQRYLIRPQFLSYLKMCGDPRRVIMQILYDFLPLQILILIISSILLNGFTVSLLPMILINLLAFGLFLVLNTGIYIIGLGKKEVDFEKGNTVEIMSGILLVMQFSIIFLGRF